MLQTVTYHAEYNYFQNCIGTRGGYCDLKLFIDNFQIPGRFDTLRLSIETF